MKSLHEFASGLESRTKCAGNHDGASTRILKAGGLTILYDTGSLRYIRDDKDELLRNIYFAVRDPSWFTIFPNILEEETEIYESSFRIRYKAIFEHEEISLKASFIIEGRSDSSIVVRADGEAITTFRKNRIGFCVLHPIENCAGKTCVITHIDDSKETTSFPEAISPHQPFIDIKSMSWPVFKGKCFLNFSGDIFESEDQRNWGDASYKTYSTPLSVPFPAMVEAGTTFSQVVEFRLEKSSFKPATGKEPVKITISTEELIPMPLIGIAQSSRMEPLSGAELRILRALHPDHYRVDLFLFEKIWELKADQAINESAGVNCSIEAALFFDDDYVDQITQFFRWAEQRNPEIKIIHLFHKTEPVTPAQLSETIIPRLRSFFPDVKIGIGTNENFVKINRNRTGNQDNELVTWSVHPQEHASDNRTIVENLSAQGDMVRSARTFSEDKEMWVSTVNLRRRFNDKYVYSQSPYFGTGIPPQIDSRQMSLLGACWTAGSLKYLSEAGAKGITYYETAGERGVIQGEFESRWPNTFPVARGMVFPMFFVLKFMLRNKGLKILRSTSSSPLASDSLILSDGKQVMMMITNFTDEPVKIVVSGCTGMFRIKALSEKTFADAVSNYLWTCEGNEKALNSGKQIELEPCSVTFIEGWLKH
jgi:hypothetical protein